MSERTETLIAAITDQLDPLAYARLASEYESTMTVLGVAGIVVRPDTVSHLTIWNGENVGGKSLVIDRLFSFNLVSTAAPGFFTLWYCNHLVMTKVTNDTTLIRGTGDGREPDNSMVPAEADATVLDNGWFPCGGNGKVCAAGVVPSGGTEWEAAGRIVVEPKAGLSIAVSSSAVGETYQVGASWWRTQL